MLTLCHLQVLAASRRLSRFDICSLIYVAYVPLACIYGGIEIMPIKSVHYNAQSSLDYSLYLIWH